MLIFLIFEDLRDNPHEPMRRLYQFLGVYEFVPTMSIRYNVSGAPRNRFLWPVLTKTPLTITLGRCLPVWLRQPAQDIQEFWRSKQLVKPPLEAKIRRKLLSVYGEDILRLQELIQRDLSKWLDPAGAV